MKNNLMFNSLLLVDADTSNVPVKSDKISDKDKYKDKKYYYDVFTGEYNVLEKSVIDKIRDKIINLFSKEKQDYPFFKKLTDKFY